MMTRRSRKDKRHVLFNNKANNMAGEFRVTFPLKCGSFSAFSPNFYVNELSEHTTNCKFCSRDCFEDEDVLIAQAPVISEKIKTDEYLLLPGSRCNVKFGDGGKTFDIKKLNESDIMMEDWQGICKGTLPIHGDISSLVSQLKTIQETKSDDDREALLAVIRELESLAPIKRVFTRKSLTTMKFSAGWVVEQIDFSLWDRESTVDQDGTPAAPSMMFRSISLEGCVPAGLAETTLKHVQASCKSDPVIFGGFPKMLEVAIASPLQPNQLLES